MIEKYFPCDVVRRRLRERGFGDLFEELVERLDQRGYSAGAIRNYVWGVEHFVAWLNREKLGLSDVNRPLIRKFLDRHLPNCKCPRPAPGGLPRVRPAVNHLLRMLQERNPTEAMAVTSPIEAELQAYREHLQKICGLSESTCVGRVRFAREFLEKCFGNGELRWDVLGPENVISFVTSFSGRCRAGSVQVAASALRTFLRYLRYHGRCDEVLITAVPRIPNWRLSQIPKTMTGAQLQAFLESFDRSKVTGRRDYAMALCQAIMGLRASEVAAILLDDIDWHAGVLRIEAGKSLRTRELPLANRVGQAIADYVSRGRPQIECRNVFLRHRAPRGAVSLAVVREAMRLAFARTDGCEQWKGTHVLRHTAATNLLNRGTNLKEISDVLGHRSIETTMVYTKVDVANLQTVMMPWPEVKS